MRVQSLLYLHPNLGHPKFIVVVLGSPPLLHGRGGQAIADSSLNTISQSSQGSFEVLQLVLLVFRFPARPVLSLMSLLATLTLELLSGYIAKLK